jgi:hypothetical protein
MPALPSVAKTIRCDLHFSIGPVAHNLSRFFVEYTSGPPTAADMVTLANGVMTAWGAHMAGLFPSDQALDYVYVEDLDSATGASAISTSSAVSGTSGTLSRSAQDSVLLHFGIARRYRGGKPRLYLPPFDVSFYADERSWNPTKVAAATSAWTAFISAVVAITLSAATLVEQVNVSYYEGHHLVTYPSGWSFERPTIRATPIKDIILTVAAELIIATVKRRLGREA